jgi:hypothetical protein
LPKLVIAKKSKLRRFEGVSEAGAFSRNPEPQGEGSEARSISAMFGSSGNQAMKFQVSRI